jgi:GDSL-like lipase/acylhydrolase family protein
MRRILVVIVGLLTLVQVASHGQAARLHPHRIAVFGSSVANGRGDELARDGYTGLLRVMMAQKGWEVLNQSRGGDNTKTLMTRFAPEGAPDPKTRYLMTVNPSYVVIGLSFGNENLYESKTTAEKDAVYAGYLKGIRAVVDRARQNGVTPVVMLCYTRDLYTAEDYGYVRRANLEQAQWDVPTVNVLGAIDDGKGHWALGWDDKHPQNSGHHEFLYSFVPSLFEALEKGKTNPVKASGSGFARVTSGAAPLTFASAETMHPFALSFMVRTQTDGTIAAVSGSTLATRSEIRMNEEKPFTATTLVADKSFAATLVVQNGRFGYRGAGVTSGVLSDVRADAQWHNVVLSHFTARGETLLFVDGRLAGRFAERLEPNRFIVGGPGATGGPAGPKQADYKDVFLYRSALNADEAAAVNAGKLLKGSLEIYSPLGDLDFKADGTVENRAQSLTALKVGRDRIVHVEEGTSTR